MIKAFLFDFSRTILFPKDKNYGGELNALHKALSKQNDYNFLDHFKLDEGLLSYLETIKDKYELYIFTSGSIQNAPEIKSRLDKIFKKIFSAEGIGFSKKDPKAYEYISDQIGITPDEVIFVDDSEPNIEAAKQAKMNVFLYKDFRDLREKVAKILERK